MNGFLVVWCHSMDDIPVRLFATWAEALAFVQANPLPDDDNPANVHPAAVLPEVKVWGVQCTTPWGYKIAEFRDGKLVAWRGEMWEEPVGWYADKYHYLASLLEPRQL
jgi:hypothetical protein